ncbi:MAG: phosphatase [Clostridia bacterium]|nr:phosphatase [Clostridia bacterium]
MELKIDLHTHTIASGHAYSTLLENLQEAKAKGLKMLALTDHGPQLAGGPQLFYFGNLRVLPREYLGIELLRGVEANILDCEGTLDLPDRYLAKLDIVLAGFHPGCYVSKDVEENTRALIKAMQHPYVDVITHPGNPEYPIDQEKLVEASKELGVALEINNSSLVGSRKGSLENCRKIAGLAAEKSSLIAVGSDAHWAPAVGELSKAIELITEFGIKEEQILNSSPDKVRNYLARKKGPNPIHVASPQV